MHSLCVNPIINPEAESSFEVHQTKKNSAFSFLRVEFFPQLSPFVSYYPILLTSTGSVRTKMSRKARPDGRIIRAGRPSIRILSAITAVVLLMVINGHQLEAATTTTNTTTTSVDETFGDRQGVASAVEGRDDEQRIRPKETVAVGEKILSRKRRYLIFQPGTSLQLGEFWGG